MRLVIVRTRQRLTGYASHDIIACGVSTKTALSEAKSVLFSTIKPQPERVEMKKLILKVAGLAACALTVGAFIGVLLTRTPTMENAKAQSASTANQSTTVVMQFPMGIAK